jgi:hypothetical protein
MADKWLLIWTAVVWVLTGPQQILAASSLGLAVATALGTGIAAVLIAYVGLFLWRMVSSSQGDVVDGADETDAA